jgi:hypothetical protein
MVNGKLWPSVTPDCGTCAYRCWEYDTWDGAGLTGGIIEMYRCEAGAAPAGHQEPTTSLYSHVRILLNSHSNDRNIVPLNVKLPTQIFNCGTLNPYNYSNLSHNRLSSLTVSIIKTKTNENYLIIYLVSLYFASRISTILEHGIPPSDKSFC